MADEDDLKVGGTSRPLRRLAADFAHHPFAMIGLVILVIAALDTLLAPPLVGTHDLYEPFASPPFQGASRSHPLGTDELGRDVLARLLVGVHSSALFAGMALGLAVVLGIVVLAAVRLAGRTRGQAWGRWVEVVLLPVIGVILLGLVSLISTSQVPANLPSLFSLVLSAYIWGTLSHPYFIATSVAVVLVYLLVVGEVVRFGYLLVQRLRHVKAPHSSGGPASNVSAWLSIAGSAVVVGLWIAADALLVEPAFLFYGVGLPPRPIPSLGWMIEDASTYPVAHLQLALIPLTAVLILYVALNLVGFGVRGALRRATTT